MGLEARRREALRINQRYLTEVVEALGFCPWADTVRDGDGLCRRVLFGTSIDDALEEATGELIETISADLEIAIGLLIFPELEIENAAFRRFVSRMEQRHAQQHARDSIPLAMASFHPQADADTSSPARLVPFVRRSPDPTIQLVRRDAMDNVRQTQNEGSVFVDNIEAFLPLLGKRPKPSVSDGIAKANLRTVNRLGVQHVEKIIADIKTDRDRAYAEALEPS